jgi:hypothetical protein
MATKIRRTLGKLSMSLSIALLTICGVAAQRALAVTVYDAVVDFSASANPNGVWAYGWSATLGSALNLYTNSDSTCYTDVSGWSIYTCSSGNIPPPATLHNNTNHIVSLAPDFPDLKIPRGTLLMHPGPAGQYSVLQWTASSSGRYQIWAFVNGLDPIGPTSTDVHIFVTHTQSNSTVYLFSGQLYYSFGVPLIWPPWASTPPIFAKNTLAAGPLQDLAAGDTVTFAVGFGVDGNYGGDSTGVEAVIRSRGLIRSQAEP